MQRFLLPALYRNVLLDQMDLTEHPMDFHSLQSNAYTHPQDSSRLLT